MSPMCWASVYDEPLPFDAARVGTLPRTFIECTRPALATLDLSRQRVRSEPGWQVVQIDTSHDAMVSAPETLLGILLGLA